MTKGFPKQEEAISDPGLVRVIGFYNIYHQMWAMLEQEKILMNWENTIFIIIVILTSI